MATLQFYFQAVPQNDLREVEGLHGTNRVQSFMIAVAEVHVDPNDFHRVASR